MLTSQDAAIGFFDNHELDAITTLSRSTRWRLQRQGKFPALVELSPGRKGAPKQAVLEWLAEKEGREIG